VPTWTERELELLGGSPELDIAVRGADGTPRRWTPIWVVRANDRVYVRSWHRRDTGWFGAAVRSLRARIRVPGLEADAVVTDLGDAPADLRDSIDAAYRDKYGDSGSASMIGASAAATTLRLDPEPLIDVDGEVFRVVASAERPGQYDYTWVSGPNPGYGFSGASSDRREPTESEHEESVREFLAQIDPATGYLAD